MKTERLELDGEIFLPVKQKGKGGLASVADALAACGVAVAPPDDQPKAAGLEAMPIKTACASVERAAGSLLLEVQGQSDLQLCRNYSRKLAGRMSGAGAVVSPEQIQDATGAGCVALGVWRATGKGSDGEPERLASRVAWRAVVQSMSADRFGESISLDTISDDWLWHNAEPTCQSRAERAAQLWVERAADQRQARLAVRMSRLPGGRGKRGQVIERVTNCAALLLDGFRLDEAASAAGFKGGKARHRSAGDTFCQALRRLGFEIRGHARQSLREPAKRRDKFVNPMDGGTLASVTGDLFAVALSDGCIEWQAASAASVSPCQPSQNLAALLQEQSKTASKAKGRKPKATLPKVAGAMVVYPKLAKVKRDGGVYLA